jgi:hypothetical protein
MPAVAVVVAKFREDVSWLASMPPHWDVFVYDKSDGTIPNVGREAETYARFVAERYDQLPRWDCVVFLQGNPFDHVEAHALPTRDEHLQGLHGLAGMGLSFESDGNGAPHHAGLPVDAAHALLFGEGHGVTRWPFHAGAQYVVPATMLRRRGRAFWARLRRLLADGDVCAWTMERLWPYAFGALDSRTDAATHTDAAHTDATHTDATHTDAMHTDAMHTDASNTA